MIPPAYCLIGGTRRLSRSTLLAAIWRLPSRSTIGVHAVLRQPMSSSKTDTPGCWPCRAPRTTLTPIPSRSTIDDYAAFPAAHCATRFRYNWPVGLVAFHDRRSCSPSCGLASNNPVTIHSMEPCPISIQMLTRILIARRLEILNLKLLCVQIQSTFFYTKLLLSLKVQSLNLFLTSIINMDR